MLPEYHFTNRYREPQDPYLKACETIKYPFLPMSPTMGKKSPTLKHVLLTAGTHKRLRLLQAQWECRSIDETIQRCLPGETTAKPKVNA